MLIDMTTLIFLNRGVRNRRAKIISLRKMDTVCSSSQCRVWEICSVKSLIWLAFGVASILQSQLDWSIDRQWTRCAYQRLLHSLIWHSHRMTKASLLNSSSFLLSFLFEINESAAVILAHHWDWAKLRGSGKRRMAPRRLCHLQRQLEWTEDQLQAWQRTIQTTWIISTWTNRSRLHSVTSGESLCTSSHVEFSSFLSVCLSVRCGWKIGEKLENFQR